jgi:serine phosphatase RsbU (regulator of sigma subunit)
MEILVAVAKTGKYATSSSGDTVEVVERPGGGVSLVLADGQSSGFGAKAISSLVVRKVISLLSEGVRDGAAARAASDYLYNERKGKVSATLNILSVDLQTSTLVITRNNPAPVLLAYREQIHSLEADCKPVGLYRDTRPLISEVPLETGLTAVMYTDGLVHAGSRSGDVMDVLTCLQAALEEDDPLPQTIADFLLEHAMKLDQDRPVDDMSVVVLRTRSYEGQDIRRLTMSIPFGNL